ncbi:sensor histidine kinase, partial [Streptomyces sp. GC420]|nr:sensor histidine kinase [Streptomyces sp. GC420]
MDAIRVSREAWRRSREVLARPALWSPRRIAGEAVPALVPTVLAAGIEQLSGASAPRLVLVVSAVAALSLLRGALPA